MRVSLRVIGHGLIASIRQIPFYDSDVRSLSFLRELLR